MNILFNELLKHLLESQVDSFTISKLRTFILDLAVRGRLVPQDFDEESAEKLLHRIGAERTRLIQEGVVKRQKSLEDIDNQEKPFIIPDSWEWAYLQDIGNWGSGSTPKRGNPAYYGGEINWYKSGELPDGVMAAKSEELITERALNECSLRANQPGDVLIAMYGATIGKLGILDSMGTTNQAVCACTCYADFFNWYLFTVLLSMRQQFVGQGIGGAQPNISKDKIISAIVPIPPINEQHRIVQKVSELMASLDALEESIHKRDKTSKQLINSLIIEALEELGNE